MDTSRFLLRILCNYQIAVFLTMYPITKIGTHSWRKFSEWNSVYSINVNFISALYCSLYCELKGLTISSVWMNFPCDKVSNNTIFIHDQLFIFTTLTLMYTPALRSLPYLDIALRSTARTGEFLCLMRQKVVCSNDPL